MDMPPQSTSDVEDLPSDLLALVCAHLDTSAVAAAAAASKRWRRAFGTAVHALAPRHGLPLQRVPEMFPCLEHLSLERYIGSAITDGLLVAAVAPLRQLHTLSLRSCTAITASALAALAPSLPHLRELDLTGCCRLSSRALTVLPALPALRRLRLDKGELVDDGALAHVARAPGLEALSLRGCARVRGPGLASLASLAGSLSSLNLAGLVHLAPQHLAPLAALTRLEQLVLDRCSGLAGDGGLPALAGPLQRLTLLSLSECEVGDAALPAAARMAALRRLAADFCRHVSDAGVAALSPLRCLEALSLRGCERVRGEGMAALAAGGAGASLTALNLSWSPRLSLAGMEAVARLTALRELHLPWCGVNDRQVAALSSLTELQALSLASTPDLTAAGLLALVRGCRELTR